jgi:LPXTG-motif cell wall-anchored protein
MHQTATATRKPALAKLPHTASDLPLILIGGLLSLLAATLLSLGRRENDGA